MRTLGQPNAAFAGDHGDPDPALRAVLAQAYAGGTPTPRAVAALCTARLLLPIVAERRRGRRRPRSRPAHAEMAAVLVRSEAGATAVPVFTGMDALTAWKADARAGALHAGRCGRDRGRDEVDRGPGRPPGPHPVVIEGGLIDELAQGRRLVELPDGGFGWMYRLRRARVGRRGERGTPHAVTGRGGVSGGAAARPAGPAIDGGVRHRPSMGCVRDKWSAKLPPDRLTSNGSRCPGTLGVSAVGLGLRVLRGPFSWWANHTTIWRNPSALNRASTSAFM